MSKGSNERAGLAATFTDAPSNGHEGGQRGYGDGAGGAGSAPASPDFGISSYELAQYVRDFSRWCAQRVEGPGMVEYDRGSHQKFEVMSTQELIQGLQEELADASNYISMISLLIGRLAKSLPKDDYEREEDPGRTRPANPVSR